MPIYFMRVWHNDERVLILLCESSDSYFNFLNKFNEIDKKNTLIIIKYMLMCAYNSQKP